MALQDSLVSSLLKSKTAYNISLITGIPMSRVYRFSKGLTSIPRQYLGEVQKFYRRDSYASLRNTGFSSFQSRRFMGYNPQSRAGLLKQFHSKVQELARGYAVKRLEALGLKETEENIKRFMSAGSRKVREGLRNAKTPFEEWMEYGK